MARINLLPWRAERRQQRQKASMIMLGMSAVAGVVLAFLIITFYNGQISGQNERNAFLQAEILQLDEQIKEIEQLDAKKAKLLARKDVIEKLQADRSLMVHLFDSLVRTIPDGVVLTSIKQDAKTLTLDGRSQSSARVSTYMRNLEGSGWMTKPDLSIIEARGNDKGLPYAFQLQVTLSNPNAPTDEDGDGIADPVTVAEPDIDPSAAAVGTDPAVESDTAPAPAPAPAPVDTAAPPEAAPAEAPAAEPAAAEPADSAASGVAS